MGLMTVAAEMFSDANWLRAGRFQILPLLTSGYHSQSRLMLDVFQEKLQVCLNVVGAGRSWYSIQRRLL
jgi:hypothetical protein